MCDYSLELVTSRPAKVGDKLVSAGWGSVTLYSLQLTDGAPATQ